MRIVVKPEVIEKLFETRFAQERMKGVPADEVPREYADEAVKIVLSMSDEELFKVETFKYEGTFLKGTFKRHICHVCGELFFETAGRIEDGKPICRRCYAKLHNGDI